MRYSPVIWVVVVVLVVVVAVGAIRWALGAGMRGSGGTHGSSHQDVPGRVESPDA